MMINNSNKIWATVLNITQKQIGAERFNLWFKNVKMIEYDNESAYIVVPNPFIKSWFEDNFTSILKENIQTVTSSKVNIQISVDGKSVAVETDKQMDKIVKSEESEPQPCKTQSKSTGRLLTLDDFVVGSCNRLAYASALELIKPENNSFNALFIHGSVGVGKTHLLQGIWNSIKENNTGLSSAYLPAECWTNEFINSLQKGKLNEFRQKYRNLDVLLIDDVHFVSSKQGVQEELLHTFNILHGSSKRIVFASDSHPKFINKLKESLASRFMSGLVTKIESPDFKTAQLILESKLKKMKKEFPAAVLEYIAGIFINNIRELECALTTVLAVSNITNKRVDIAMAKEALEDHIPRRNRSITIKDIEEVTLRHFNITHSELHSNKRTSAVSHPRQVSMFLVSSLTNFSRQQIGDYFGGKKHTTVIHAVKKIKMLIERDSNLKRQIEMLKEEISKG